MPRYELCYILASAVSDDQVPAVSEQIQKFITDFDGSNINEQQLGKKKLAYPIKKTRNGFYVACQFDMPGTKVNEFEAKIRSQTATVIRHIIINLDEHLIRAEKDRVAQSKLPKRPTEEGEEGTTEVATTEIPEVAEEKTEVTKEAPEEKAKTEITAAELDKKIEEALSEKI